MTSNNIPLDKAELLAMMLEGLLYGESVSDGLQANILNVLRKGCSLPMFGGTIWALSQRSSSQRNCKILSVACSLLLCSTVHLVIGVLRIKDGLPLLQDSFPGGSIGYFSDASQWTFVSKNYVYHLQTLIGDGVVIYRCYVVWQSKLVMILPVLFWCAVLATGIATPYAELQAKQNEVFEGSLSRWITSFWASSLVTNLFTTLLLAYRIWNTDRKTTSSLGQRHSELRPILYIIIDAGMIYSFTLLTALICFINRSNVQYVILDMITPIISITFYMVIIRVALANREKQLANLRTWNVDRRSRTQAITVLVENNASDGLRSPTTPRTPLAIQTSHLHENKIDDISEVV